MWPRPPCNKKQLFLILLRGDRGQAVLGDPGRQGGCGLSCCALPGGPSILQKWSRSLLSLGKIKEWFRKASGLPAGLRQGCLRRQTGPRSLHRGRLRRRRGFRGSTGGGGASASPREEAGPQDSGRGSGRAASGGGGASAAPQEEAGPQDPGRGSGRAASGGKQGLGVSTGGG